MSNGLSVKGKMDKVGLVIGNIVGGHPLDFCLFAFWIFAFLDISVANIRAAQAGWSVGWVTGLGGDIVGLMRPSS